MNHAVVLFTRVPVPGKTKTRLMPYLSGEECARLHRCFLQDIGAAIREADADIFVCYTGTRNEEAADVWFRKILGPDIVCFSQQGSDLGARMYHGIAHVLELGYDACVLVGSDIPLLRSDHLKVAWKVLARKDIVLGPTTDGGYYLVGMKQPQHVIFDRQTYSHDQVLQNALKAAEGAGLTWGLTGTLSDVDTVEDYLELRADLLSGRFHKVGCRNRAEQIGSHVAGFMYRKRKISVIVPVYNEEKSILSMQHQLKPYLGFGEILFVDGGSSDGTLALISPDFQVLHAPKGRANQMNYGAEHSSGDILFFLHCDSVLPEGWDKEIRRVMRRYPAGCFGIAFTSKHPLMWICQNMSNLRAKYRKIVFGDQGIFMDRSLFFELGGYPDLPLMEDYQLSLTMREKKVPVGMTARRIYTSDRRFPKGIIPKLRVMWQMNRLRKQYREGVSMEEIARQYKDIR